MQNMWERRRVAGVYCMGEESFSARAMCFCARSAKVPTGASAAALPLPPPRLRVGSCLPGRGELSQQMYVGGVGGGGSVLPAQPAWECRRMVCTWHVMPARAAWHRDTLRRVRCRRRERAARTPPSVRPPVPFSKSSAASRKWQRQGSAPRPSKT